MSRRILPACVFSNINMSVAKKSFQQVSKKYLSTVNEIAKIEKGKNKAIKMLSNDIIIPVLADIVAGYLQDTSANDGLVLILSDINDYIKNLFVRRYHAKSSNIKSKATERLYDVKDLLLELRQSNSMLTEEMLEKFEYVAVVYKRNRYEL
jgi:hypothetical protein